MKKIIRKNAFIISAFIISFSAILSSFHLQDQGDCVVISTWKDCNELCTNAKCIQFKNNCTYKVKVTYKTKNSTGTWTNHELYLNSGEESAESMICPYIDMKWSYAKSN